jgi:hypothetical protein
MERHGKRGKRKAAIPTTAAAPTAAVVKNGAAPKRYKIVAAGPARVNPYDVAYGPDPYRSESGTRREVAFIDGGTHPNAAAAVSELVEKGKLLENWILLLTCVEKHKAAQQRDAQETTAV